MDSCLVVKVPPFPLLITLSLIRILCCSYGLSPAETVKSQTRKPKCSKGYHCSRNAYMLVYKCHREEDTDPMETNVEVPGEDLTTVLRLVITVVQYIMCKVRIELAKGLQCVQTFDILDSNSQQVNTPDKNS